MDIKSEIIEILQSCGVQIDPDSNKNLSEDLDNVVDSIMFISLVVEMEQIFGIEIPDEYLNINLFSNIDTTEGVIRDLIERRTEN